MPAPPASEPARCEGRHLGERIALAVWGKEVVGDRWWEGNRNRINPAADWGERKRRKKKARLGWGKRENGEQCRTTRMRCFHTFLPPGDRCLISGLARCGGSMAGGPGRACMDSGGGVG